MAAHRKPRKLVFLAVGLCALLAGAFGGYALAGSVAGSAARLASASGASGRVPRVRRPPPSSPPSPVPATTPPSPSPTRASMPASWAWCSSASLGQSPALDGRFDLYNNEWNTSASPGPQTICGNSPSDWQVTSTQRAGNTEVLTYPSVQVNYNGTNGYPLR